MARRIQNWWRRLLNEQQSQMMTVAMPCERDSDWSAAGMKGSDWPQSEQDLIQTVLRKYETLQRQSQSLVYSFAERKSRRYWGLATI